MIKLRLQMCSCVYMCLFAAMLYLQSIYFASSITGERRKKSQHRVHQETLEVPIPWPTAGHVGASKALGEPQNPWHFLKIIGWQL